ncbi:unnamed protein product [Parascedosporium putredinis]|uniref:Uncharacterized protein n=1 Tax=Parascedosporium putredinis TaxID=1442378 RepID=A0A9P1H4B6_9PEZI|nr:unnamed protein product [Parascedosporium putredinis]CAI7995433.1 unnamed protein product [Parascedosporium putredinis]
MKEGRNQKGDDSPISFHQNSSGLDGLALDSSAAGLPLSTGTKQPVEPESGIKGKVDGREASQIGSEPDLVHPLATAFESIHRLLLIASTRDFGFSRPS